MTPPLCFPLPGMGFCLTIKLITLSPFLVIFVYPEEFLTYVLFHTPRQ